MKYISINLYRKVINHAITKGMSPNGFWSVFFLNCWKDFFDFINLDNLT